MDASSVTVLVQAGNFLDEVAQMSQFFRDMQPTVSHESYFLCQRQINVLRDMIDKSQHLMLNLFLCLPIFTISLFFIYLFVHLTLFVCFCFFYALSRRGYYYNFLQISYTILFKSRVVDSFTSYCGVLNVNLVIKFDPVYGLT